MRVGCHCDKDKVMISGNGLKLSMEQIVGFYGRGNNEKAIVVVAA